VGATEPRTRAIMTGEGEGRGKGKELISTPTVVPSNFSAVVAPMPVRCSDVIKKKIKMLKISPGLYLTRSN